MFEKRLNSKFYLSPKTCKAVYTLEDYKALPLEQREIYGLYKIPFGLAIDLKKFSMDKKSEWDLFYDYIRQEYPIQWFFRHWITSWDNPMYAFLKLRYMRYLDAKYAVKRFITPLFPLWRKSCQRHEYKDICSLVVDSNFALILDFWHQEVSRNTINWNSDPSHKTFYKELKNVVKYIETDRKTLEAKSDNALSLATKKPRTLTYQQRYGKHLALEEKIRIKDTEILTWFVENRNYFWT
jgi:hypothetical protein